MLALVKDLKQKKSHLEEKCSSDKAIKNKRQLII